MSQSGLLLNSSTNFININAGIMRVTSVLETQVKVDDIYTCLIENALVKAISEATVTGKTVDIDNKM